MRPARIVFACLVSVLFSIPATPQQQGALPTQASTLLTSSLGALSGSASVTDVTLAGTAQSIAGSDNETGTASLTAVSAGASSLVLTLSGGSSSEILNATVTPPSGTWSGADGKVHTIAYHNLLTGPSWFFPAFSLASASYGANSTVTYVGQETHNGETVQHLTIIQTAPVGIQTSDCVFPHLTQLEFYLDSTTLLPSAVDFTTHPDDNELADIPVEIRFASYTNVSGAQIPFHIQRFVNNSLALDLHVQTAALNSGLTISQVTGQ